MTDRQRDLSRLLASTAREHHEATGGPNEQWPEWYAERIQQQFGEIVGVMPDVETLAGWLRTADNRYREQPDGSWPSAYAAWIIEWAGAVGP